MVVRVQGCKQLLRRFSAGTHSTIVIQRWEILHYASLWKLSSTIKTTVSLLQMPLLPIQVVETSEGKLIPNLWWFEQSRLRTKKSPIVFAKKGLKNQQKSLSKDGLRRYSPSLNPNPLRTTFLDLSTRLRPHPQSQIRATMVPRKYAGFHRLLSMAFHSPRFEFLDYSIWSEL